MLKTGVLGEFPLLASHIFRVGISDHLFASLPVDLGSRLVGEKPREDNRPVGGDGNAANAAHHLRRRQAEPALSRRSATVGAPVGPDQEVWFEGRIATGLIGERSATTVVTRRKSTAATGWPGRQSAGRTGRGRKSAEAAGISDAHGIALVAGAGVTGWAKAARATAPAAVAAAPGQPDQTVAGVGRDCVCGATRCEGRARGEAVGVVGLGAGPNRRSGHSDSGEDQGHGADECDLGAQRKHAPVPPCPPCPMATMERLSEQQLLSVTH